MGIYDTSDCTYFYYSFKNKGFKISQTFVKPLRHPCRALEFWGCIGPVSFCEGENEVQRGEVTGLRGRGHAPGLEATSALLAPARLSASPRQLISGSAKGHGWVNCAATIESPRSGYSDAKKSSYKTCSIKIIAPFGPGLLCAVLD